MNEQPIYIGNKLVKNNVSSDNKLPTGEDLFELEYEDGSKETLTRRMFEHLIKNESTDATTLRDNRVVPVVQEVLKMCLNWGLKIDEIDYMCSLLTTSLNENLKEADARVWGKSRHELTLIDLDSKLRTTITMAEYLNQDATPEQTPSQPETPSVVQPETPAEEPKVEEQTEA